MKVDAGLVRVQQYPDIRIAFDATSTGAHRHRSEALFGNGRQVIDLPPAAIDPYTVPTVNIDQHLDASNLNMVTCGGQAAIPVVAAVSRIARVRCGEIVASISSRSAGLGTRTNIDEFTQTAAAIEQVGGAERGSAVIVLNSAEPPMRMMRDTVF